MLRSYTQSYESLNIFFPSQRVSNLLSMMLLFSIKNLIDMIETESGFRCFLTLNAEDTYINEALRNERPTLRRI